MGAKQSQEVRKAYQAWLRGNSVPNAARVGGVNKVTLYNLLKSMGITDFKQHLYWKKK